jgi:hypothetical protein
VDGLFWVEVWGKSLSEWRHCLNHLGGIVGVIFELRTRWASNIETK